MALKKAARKQCFDRDNYTCVKCGSKDNLTVDHVIPVTMKGGINGLANLQTLCLDCNQLKDRTVAQYTNHKSTKKHLRKYGYIE